MPDQEIAPGLLLAMPQLADPNFARAVVLMIEHDAGGSFGLILNRCTPVPVSEVFDALSLPWSGDDDALVWIGGPVMQHSRWALHDPVDLKEAEGLFDLVPGIMLSTHPLQHEELAASPPANFRFLLGYSGWGPGQLEAELAQGSWLVAEATPRLVFDTDPDEMWETAIRSLGIEPSTLVPGVGIH